MLIRSKLPGAPVLPSGSVAGWVGPIQGQVALPLSFGLRTLTPIGATYFASSIRLARALACEPTVTVLTPKSLVKMPFAGRVRLTRIVSLVAFLLDSVTVGVPPPLLVT